MYEYKVLTTSVKDCEKKINELASEGWRLAAMVPDNARGMGVVATMEREAKPEE